MQKKFHALLVYPEIPDTFWSFKNALHFINKKTAMPPLGLITIAAMMPQAWDIRLVDMNIEPLKDIDVIWADTVFVSAMSVQKQSVHKVLERCRLFGKKTVAGGPLFSTEYDNYLQTVDHLVLNEGEITFALFLTDFISGNAKQIYTTDHFAKLEESITPMYELLKMKNYATMPIQFSRGCPYDCEFCNITSLFGNAPRVKTSIQIVRELDKLYALGWRRSVFFVDDNFIGNKKALKSDILPVIADWRADKTGMSFFTEASINLAHDEQLMDMLLEAGFSAVFIGIESPDEDSLRECNKLQNQKLDLVESVKIIQRKGLQVQGGFIVGFDNDKPNIFEKQLEYIQESGIVIAMVGMLQAMRGTKLWKRLLHEDRITCDVTGDNADGSTNIIPKMGLENLKSGFNKLVSKLFTPKNYYNRIKTFLKHFRPCAKIKPYYELQDIVGFFKAIYKLGITGKEKFEYWKLFFWTLLHKPNMLPLAVTLAVYGYHFRIIYHI